MFILIEDYDLTEMKLINLDHYIEVCLDLRGSDWCIRGTPADPDQRIWSVLCRSKEDAQRVLEDLVTVTNAERVPSPRFGETN